MLQQASRSTKTRDVGAGFAELLRKWRQGAPARPAIIMGIINVTPDSFSDGGLFHKSDAAVAQGRRLLGEGAAILDIGGESTRAGAQPVTAEEETARILPVIAGLHTERVMLSVDTMKAKVAEAALVAGAHIINDIRGLQGDPGTVAVAAEHGAGLIIMHNPGVLGSAKEIEGDPVKACLTFFSQSLAAARKAGVREDRIVLDPGFGFGKSPEQNLELVARISELRQLGFPILVGTSRKSFIGKVTGREAPDDRLIGTIVINVIAAYGGAAIIRVHDVAEHVEAMRMTAAVHGAGGPPLV
jgi:dihydropteroate synthase